MKYRPRDGRAPWCEGTRLVAVVLLGIAALPSRPCKAVAVPLFPDASPATPHHHTQGGVARLRNIGLKLCFEMNQGQVDPQVKFRAHSRGYTLYLTADEVVLATSAAHADETDGARHDGVSVLAPPAATADVWRLRLVGAIANAVVVGEEPLAGKTNYFLGDNPQRWHTGIPQYARVRYRNVYPGIDMVFYGNSEGEIEYDFVISPGGDPGRIQLDIATAVSDLTLDASGDLLLRMKRGELRLRRAKAYQDSDGTRREVAARYVVEPARDDSDAVDTAQTALADRFSIRLELGAYRPAERIVVDPVLVYSTYLGGTRTEWVADAAVDRDGNAYVVGSTTSADFPAQGHFGTGSGSNAQAFILKLSPTGDSVLYATYLGGSSGATATSVAIDDQGAVYVAGQTTSIDFPTTTQAFQREHTTGHIVDSFVTKLAADGATLAYSTFLGGSGEDSAEGIALDHDGNAYIVGATSSPDFPVVDAFQPAFSGGGGDPFDARDAFVAELDTAGETLLYGSYLGGSTGRTVAADVAVDGAGAIYVAGSTAATNFPVGTGAFQAEPGGGVDAFLVKLKRGGDEPVYATYLGGSADDAAVAIAVDAQAQAHVVGMTRSSDFPTIAAPQPGYGGGQSDAFVSKLDGSGSHLVYSTYLGGSGQFSSPLVGDEGAQDIALDDDDNAYVTGVTNSSDFPLRDPFDGENQRFDAFVTSLNAVGQLQFSTFLGGESSIDRGNAIACGQTGTVYVAGGTWAVVADFPTVAPLQALNQGDVDGFVAKLDLTSSAQLCAYVLISAAQGVSDEASGTVAVIEAARKQVTGRFRVGNITDRLFDLAISSQSGTGYIVDAGPLIVPQSVARPPSQFIALVDTRQHAVIDRVSLPAPGNGYLSLRHLARAPDDRTVYVDGGGDVVAIDAGTRTPLGGVAADAAGDALVIAPDGRLLFTTHAGSDEVLVIDAASRAVVNTVTFPPGSAPTGATISPDGARLYVAARDLRSVGVVDVATAELVDLVPVSPQPERVAVSPDGRSLYVLHTASSTFGMISIIDTASRQQVGTVALNEPVSDLAVTPDGKFLYVTNGNAGTVTVIETEAHQIVAIIPVGASAGRIQLAKLPNGCTVQPVCPGDCNNDGAVTVAELVRAVSVALGSLPAADCPAADLNGDAMVAISELLQAVNAALAGCPNAR